MRKIWLILLLAGVVFLGLCLRLWKLELFAGFDFDQETAAMWVREFLVYHKVSLVGQELSLGGGFLGPLFYYLLAIFYWIFRFDPLAANVMVTLISLFTLLAIFNLGRILWGSKTGLLGALLYALSWQINFYDRTTAPSNLIMLFSVIIATLSLGPISRKKLVALGLVFGLAASIHPTLFFLLPAVVALLWPRKDAITRNDLILSLAPALVFISPLIIFELRHSFIGVGRLLTLAFNPLLSTQSYPAVFKLLINFRTLTGAFLQLVLPVGLPSFASLMLGSGLIVLLLRQTRGAARRLLTVWLLSPLVVLSFYSQNVPEYYFLVTFPIFLLYCSRLLLQLGKTYPLLGPTALALFTLTNLFALSQHDNPVGMVYKKAAVNFIKRSAGVQSVKLDYYTDPGQNNGFNYLAWYEELTLSPKGRTRYIIVVPKELSPETGAEFGGIKVLRDEKYLPILP